jgi:hypothetical protein
MKYLNAYALTARAVPGRLNDINKPGIAFDLWEQLHLDLHDTLAARLCLAQAQRHLQGKSPAQAELLAELAALRKSGLSQALDQALQNARGRPALAQRLEWLSHDWSPQGHLYWLEESARADLKQ